MFLDFPCDSAGKESACNAGDLGSIPRLGRSPGEGKGYPFQYSGLENSMDCTVHGVEKSRTQLRDLHYPSKASHLPFITVTALPEVKLSSLLAGITLLGSWLLCPLPTWPYSNLSLTLIQQCSSWNADLITALPSLNSFRRPLISEESSNSLLQT